MEYKPGRTSSYRFTIRTKDENDQKALANLRETISQQNKVIRKNRALPDKYGYWKGRPILRVTVKFRKPELNHPYTMGAHRLGTKYGAGGSVRKEQLPAEADVYILHQRD